jgi:o-succinylbenzoate---CoA ligase
LTATSQTIHPDFKLNNLSFSSTEALLNYTDKLLEKGNEQEMSAAIFIKNWLDVRETVVVKTSGSTGKPKKITLTKQHMANSAKATGAYFNAGSGTKALLCIPTDFIAGKMMLVRAMLLGWDLALVQPTKDALVEFEKDLDFVAMVPYQVAHSLEALSKVKQVIIGGGAISESLEEKLQTIDVAAFATYGMTETITHVAVRRINGASKSKAYSALPDVKFSQDDRGCLIIHAPKISDEAIATNDMVDLKSPTSFNWLGRCDNVINSGGIKLFPERIEAKLSDKITYPFIIASEKDNQLGERVILIYQAKGSTVLDLSKAFEVLEPYERPKKVYRLPRFAYTKTGKIKRGDVMELLKKYR